MRKTIPSDLVRPRRPSLRDTRLRPIGRLVRADSAGLLPRLGQAPVGRLGAAVTDFVRELHLQIGDPEVSVVLRGSLARGEVHHSDIDLMLISPRQLTLPSLGFLPTLPVPVEMGLIPLEEFQDPDRGAWRRFSLAHAGWTLAGRDRLLDLPPPRMSSVVLANLRGVRRWWPRHPQDWVSGLGERRLTNGWLAKRIIRSLAEGEMVNRRVYSRAVWPCLQMASLAFPTQVALLTSIAQQVIQPGGRYSDRARLLAARPLLESAYARHLHRPLRLPF